MTVDAANAFHHRDFTLLWSGAVVSSTGNWMQLITVPYVVFELTGSSTWVGATSFATLMPSFVVTPLAGAMADRLSRRTILIGANLAAAAVATVLAGMWILEVRQPGWYLAAAAVGGSVSVGTQPAWHSVLSDVVAPPAVSSAVSLNSAQVSIGRTVGPGVGGLVLAGGGPGWAFALNAASFLAILAVLAVVRPPRQDTPPTTEGVLRQIGLAWSHIRSDPAMRAAYGLLVLLVFMANPLQQLITPVVKTVLERGPATIGLLVAAYGVGSVVGAAVVPRVSNARRRGRAVQLAAALLGSLVAAVAVVPWVWLVTVVFFVQGVAYMVVVSSLVSTFHLRSVSTIRGRVIALFLVGFTTAMALGSVVQSAIGDLVGLRVPLAVAGGGLALRCVVGAFSKVQPLDLDSSSSGTASTAGATGSE